jgi:vancomycin resistance protein YoaR
MSPEVEVRPRFGALRLGAGVLCLAAAGGSAALAMAPTPEPAPAPPAEVFVAALAVDLEEEEPQAQAQRLARAYLAETVELRADGAAPLTRTRRELGVMVNVPRLAALLSNARDPRSAMRRLHAQVAGDAPLHLPMPAHVADPRLTTGPLLALKDLIDRPAVPSRMDTERKRLTDAREGRHLHVTGTLDRLAAAARSGERVVHVRVDASGTERSAQALRAASMNALLGDFETRYSTGRDAADRTHNLRVAAQKLDGLVLLPGEELDFNEAVGDRSEANGFRPAPQIEGGELVDGVGGGACQIAGTLHAAAYMAGLPILERHPHSRPSWYIKLGLDAAVSYPTLNLRFRNDLRHPVVVQMRVEGGAVRAALWGPERSRTVTFEREVAGVTAFETREQEDPDLPAGVRVLAQRGIPAFEIRRRRVVESAAGERREEESIDRYPATPQVWRVGTGNAAPDGFEPPRGDRHPEYVADERLVMTQGPDVTGTRERREAGRTGTYGWMVREGLVEPEPAAAP